MKRIIACILVVISLFFGVACKDKKTEESFQYKEGHIFLTELFGEFFENTGRVDFKLLDKNKISKEEYRHYSDFFEMGFECILIFSSATYPIICIAEYRSEMVAEYYTKQFNKNETSYFRYRNLMAYEMKATYNILKAVNVVITKEHESGSLLSVDEKTFVSYKPNKIQEEKQFQLFDGIEIITGSAFEEGKLEEVICNRELRIIVGGSFGEYLPLRRIILNENLKEIGFKAFYGCENFEYTVIPLSVEKIGEGAFSHGSIFCEVEGKPIGWANEFYCEQAKVYWKGEWEYDENGKPIPIKQNTPPTDGE